ncbi:MAG: SDR family oxidoreductase [Pseudomonadota bacterium]
MARYLIVGGSRGIGKACAEHLAGQGHDILSVSRTQSRTGEWIEADIGTAEGIDHVVRAIGSGVLDGLLYLGGIWEEGAFTDSYDFLKSPVGEIQQVIAVNLTAPILLARGLVSALSLSDNARIVLMGSVSGLENSGGHEVANTASKFGLRGAAEALNASLRPLGIATTVINPANVATPEVFEDIARGDFGPQVPIAMKDMTATLDYILRLSPDSVPSTIDLKQTKPSATSRSD